MTQSFTPYLYELVTCDSRDVLCHVVEWGTPRRKVNQTFWDYLTKEKGYTIKNLKGVFTHTEREKLKTSGIRDYNVSLLCQCIQYGCEGLAGPKDPQWTETPDTLEFCVLKLKEFRNDFMHEEFTVDDHEAFLAKVEVLRNLLNIILRKASVVYNVDITRMLKELNKNINDITRKPLNRDNISRLNHEKLWQHVYTSGKLELKEKYQEMSVIGPVRNLLDDSLKVNFRVDKIFTRMLIKEESAPSFEYVDYENLLKCIENKESQKDNVILLLDGPAGVGKTTLTRKMISDWASERSSMENLTKFHMAILTECRNKDISSLEDLLSTLMPKVSNELPDNNLVKYIANRKILFIVDGLDELNPSSDKVLQQIMNLGKSLDVTVICTTRPNRVNDFERRLPDSFAIMHMKVTGIDGSRREEFVRNYSRALDDEGQRDISGLIQYLTRKESLLQDHWNLPFNLALVTILWFLDPDAVNKMTTATELFIKTHELSQKKLKQRLLDHKKEGGLDSKRVSEKVDTFLKKLSKEALNNHYRDDTVLSSASVERLNDVCKSLQLPNAEVLGSFLIHAVSLTDKTEKYSFPHKGLQDFLSALHIKENLISYDMDFSRIIQGIRTTLLCNVPSNASAHILEVNRKKLQELEWNVSDSSLTIYSVLENTVKEAQKHDANERKVAKLDLEKCQNIFIHLTGLLYHRGKSLKEDRCAELVSLLKDSGIRDRTQWLSLLSEVKCDETVRKCIAQAMDLKEVEISDSQVTAYASVLRHARPSHVEVDISGDPQDVPRLQDLLSAIEATDWKTDLRFRHDFRYMRGRSSVLDERLKEFFGSSKAKLTWFNGWLSGLATKALPSCLQYLELAVKNDAHYRELLPYLSSLARRLPRLEWLGLHVALGIDTTLLKPLPKVNRLSLTMDKVTDETIGWACSVASALRPSPKKRYFSLVFPDILRSEDTYGLLVRELVYAGVRVEGVMRTSPADSADDGKQRQLDDLTRRALECYFEASNDDIWHRKPLEALRDFNRLRHEEHFL
ncbi:uncharacterized protein [Penaeus vannamei]|uniref:uncharacterized protein n=1 Tax=Penaeus vannamei TaxID=6689 RepID=UPI00387F5504